MAEISLIRGTYSKQHRQKSLWQPRQSPRICNQDTSCELNQLTRTYRKDICT